MDTLESTARDLHNIRNALDRSAIVAITDRAGRIIHVNDKFCEISQYSREELLGQNHRIINSGHHPRAFFEAMWKTIAGGEIWEGEIRNRAKDGSLYWVNTTIVPFVGADGRPDQYVSIRYEITQRKRAEEKLQAQEARALVQERLATIGVLAPSLAHEIGTPLSVIRGRAEYLALQLEDNAVIQKNVDIIIAQIDRVAALIRSLLNLARGDHSPGQRPVLLHSVLTEVLDLMAYDLQKYNISVQNDIPLNSLVSAEPSALHQVFLNLAVNSVHAIEYAIKMQNRPSGHSLRLHAEDRGSQWAIGITDSGCGISETNKRNLFQPFFTTKDVGSGTGLGLVTCYRIIEAWGGSIEVESVEGQGTTFWVLLPHLPVSTEATA